MAELREGAWGHTDRHYAASMTEALRAARRADEQGAKWAKALERASPGIRDSVERAYKQWNTILREYMRSETGLRLAVGGDLQSVPVRVVGVCPGRSPRSCASSKGSSGCFSIAR